MGASSFVVSRRAFQGLTETAAEDCALFLLLQSEQGQKERMATGASEKLAQEGLCGNRDRLAVGKRVGSGVREVSHDLKGVRGAGSLLRQYQTDRWVRMVNTKLTDRPEWYDLFNNAAEDCALFLLPPTKKGKRRKWYGKTTCT